MPGALFAWSGEESFASSLAFVFLPRAIELWRVRDQPRPVARALAYSALAGPILVAGFFVLILLLGAAAPGDTPEVSHAARGVGLFIVSYYVVVATFTAWMRVRVEIWRN
jgi:hypothetical protein